jgi:vitamin B12 transporter
MTHLFDDAARAACTHDAARAATTHGAARAATILTAALAATLYSAAARSDSASDAAGAVNRDVIVTATRIPQPAAEVLAPVVVIDRETIERSLAPDVADLLRFHAGLDFARNGGPGQTTSMFIRGTESNHAIVMVDGVRINPGTIGGAALQNVAPELIERIEVVKGPRSVLYGTDAIGGVVNLITRRHAGDSLRALVGYGRYGLRQAQVGGSYEGRLGEVTLDVSSLDFDGFPTRQRATTDRGYENRSFAVGARTEAGPVELAARAWRASGTSEYSDFFLAPVDQDYENSSLSVEAAGQVTGAWRTRVLVSRVVDDVQQNQESFPGSGLDYARTRRNSVDWQNAVEAGSHVLTFGALLTRENTGTLSFGSGFDVDTDANTFYAQDQIAAGPHRLLLAAGYTDHETFGGHATWNVEYGLNVGRDTLLTAAAGTAFRAPDSTDRFGFGGNAALEPERSRNYEVGFRHRLGARHVIGLQAFDNRIDDLIQFVTVSFQPFVGQNRNVDRARIRGVEASWEYVGDDWRARAEAIHQDPEDRSNGSRLLRRAEQSYTLALSRRYRGHELGVDVLAAGDREDVGFPTRARLGGYVLANLSARIALTPRWALQARLENALDRDYELADGYRTMGRAFMLAARYDVR